jgi:hypothetical protein
LKYLLPKSWEQRGIVRVHRPDRSKRHTLTRAINAPFFGLPLRVFSSRYCSNLSEEVIRCGIRHKNGRRRRHIGRFLPDRDEFNVFVAILQPFRCVLPIRPAIRNLGRNPESLPALDSSRGHGAGESQSHRFGVHSPLPLGQRTTARPQPFCIRLRLPLPRK